ncbi:MAG: TVP38/TMEM64 family protein [Desulfurivibrionaceae bacterium]
MRSRTWKKIIIIGAIVLLVVAYKFLGLDQYLTLSYLKDSQALFTEFYQANPATVIASYMGIYILVTALSLPGAAVMTLAGGALFGLLVGVIITSFASTIGATLACFVARFLLRDWVQNKFAVRLKAINDGIAREGGFYLFTLRLIPVFPFFVINLVMGLTRMSLFRFYWISQLGMLPGTIVYVNAGKELGEIDSLSGILSPGLIFSFVILGVFPLIAKKIVEWIRIHRSSKER